MLQKDARDAIICNNISGYVCTKPVKLDLKVLRKFQEAIYNLILISYVLKLFWFVDFRFGDCQVQVTVGDKNDNNPMFTNLPNETNVSEEAAVNTAFYDVVVRILKL